MKRNFIPMVFALLFCNVAMADYGVVPAQHLNYCYFINSSTNQNIMFWVDGNSDATVVGAGQTFKLENSTIGLSTIYGVEADGSYITTDAPDFPSYSWIVSLYIDSGGTLTFKKAQLENLDDIPGQYRKSLWQDFGYGLLFGATVASSLYAFFMIRRIPGDSQGDTE